MAESSRNVILLLVMLVIVHQLLVLLLVVIVIMIVRVLSIFKISLVIVTMHKLLELFSDLRF